MNGLVVFPTFFNLSLNFPMSNIVQEAVIKIIPKKKKCKKTKWLFEEDLQMRIAKAFP